LRGRLSLIEQHFSSILDHMSNTASSVHSLEERGRLMEDQLRIVRDELTPLKEHVEAFPTALRKAVRSAEAVSRRVDDLAARVAQVPDGLAEAVAQQGVKASISEQHLSTILDHMSNAAAAIHALEAQVKSMQHELEQFPAALREVRRSEREILNSLEQRLAMLNQGGIDQNGHSAKADAAAVDQTLKSEKPGRRPQPSISSRRRT